MTVASDAKYEVLVPTGYDLTAPLSQPNLKSFAREHQVLFAILAVISVTSIVAGAVGMGTSGHTWIHNNAKGLLIGGLAIPIGVGYIFYAKFLQLSDLSHKKKVTAFLLPLILVAGFSLLALFGKCNTFNSSNQFMLESVKQWQGWIGPAGILFLISLRIAFKKKVDETLYMDL